MRFSKRFTGMAYAFQEQDAKDISGGTVHE
jgi:hypothetical protein